jgi:catechol 2,3-dioxygenase-like lactoylglutathione lyase family enzyme
MLKVIEMAFACYAVTDMPRARAFYESVLGLEPTTVTNTKHGEWTASGFGAHKRNSFHS